MNIKPIEPYAPANEEYSVVCEWCRKWSRINSTCADLDSPGVFICDKCVFVHYKLDTREMRIEIERKAIRGGYFNK